MSSTLSRPRAANRTSAHDASARAVPLAGDGTPAVTGDEADTAGESEFAGFAKAVGIGVAIGLPLMMAIVTACVKVAAPDWELGPILGISLWVSIWTGMFLGGTVTVGVWAGRQHR